MTEFIQQYIDYERNVLNHSLVRKWRFYFLEKMHNFFLEAIWENYDVSEIELRHILSFITKVKNTPIKTWHKTWKYPSSSAIYNYLSWIRMFFKYLNFIWCKLKFSREQIPIYACPDKKREPMTKEEYELLRQAPFLYNENFLESLRDELLFVIPRETWLRRAEITRITFDDFKKWNRQFEILVKWWRYESVFFTKYLQEKVLKFESELRKKYPHIIRKYITSNLNVRDRWRWFTPEKASATCRKYVKILQEKWLLHRDVTLHQARHSFAMRCVYSWLSQQATTQLMRHKDPKSTLHYYHLNDSRLKQQFDQIQ